MTKEAYVIMEDDRVPFTLSENVEVGDIIQYGSEMIAVAGTSGLAGETITVYLSDVIVEAPAKTDDGINVGDKLYWDHLDRVLTLQSDSNGDGTGTKFNPAGHAVTSKAANVAGTVRFILNK
jgi:predicted RecA/RadA family phage recombinase